MAYYMTKYANILKVALLLGGGKDGKGLIVTNQMTYFGPIMEIFLDVMKESTFLISKTNTATIVHPQTREKSCHCILCTHVYYMEYHVDYNHNGSGTCPSIQGMSNRLSSFFQ